MGALSPWHVAVVLLVFVLLFGARKLPDAARGIGQSLRVLKSEVAKPSDVDNSPPPTVRSAAAVHTEPAPVPMAHTTIGGH